MKLKVGTIRKLIREALREAEDAPQPAQWTDMADASFDVKIDNYLVEGEAPKDPMVEDYDMLEADEDDAAAEEDAEAGEDPESKLPANQPEEKIDVNNYCREVARLVENFENLMDTKGIVLRRALNFVGQKYGKEQAETVKGVLETQFGLHLSDEEEEPTAPAADRAGPSMAG